MRPKQENSPKVSAEALHRYVRSRAADFGAAERSALDAWLLADPIHQEQFAQIERTWHQLDGVADAFLEERKALMAGPPEHSPRCWWPVAAAAAVALIVLAVLPDGGAPRRFESAVAQQQVVRLPAGVDITLNADSVVDVTEGSTTRVTLLRGDAFVDVHPQASGKLVVTVGGAEIRDIGTRFAVSHQATGGSLAVEEGLVELRLDSSFLQVRAGQGADFGAKPLTIHTFAQRAVAPWRQRRWQFDATPLSRLATELLRQQRIRLDIADPAVAALTVSGNFGFDEPEQVLWAAAQVHGLKLKRLGERHFSLLPM